MLSKRSVAIKVCIAVILRETIDNVERHRLIILFNVINNISMRNSMINFGQIVARFGQ